MHSTLSSLLIHPFLSTPLRATPIPTTPKIPQPVPFKSNNRIMGAFLSKLFVDVEDLPNTWYGMVRMQSQSNPRSKSSSSSSYTHLFYARERDSSRTEANSSFWSPSGRDSSEASSYPFWGRFLTLRSVTIHLVPHHQSSSLVSEISKQ